MRKQVSEGEIAGSTRERLLIAALDQLVEHGYRGATSRNIAQAAGVNEITLFRHFASKDELITTALVEKSEAHRLRLPAPTGALEDDLLRLAEELVQSIMEDSVFIIRLIPELKRLPASQQSVVTQGINAVYDTMAAFFQYYQRAGVLNA
ncbi:MAG TPA: helix-turn-helix domain-containing protein, partial [Armatimonadota bacterium]